MPRPDDSDLLADYEDGPRRRRNPLLVLAVLGLALGVGAGTVTWAWLATERAKAEARAAAEAAVVQEPYFPTPGELEAVRREAERRAAEAP